MPTLTATPSFNPFYNDLHERPELRPMVTGQTPGMETDRILQSTTPRGNIAIRKGQTMDRERGGYQQHLDVYIGPDKPVVVMNWNTVTLLIAFLLIVFFVGMKNGRR